MYYHYIDLHGKIIASNLTDEILANYKVCKTGLNRIMCPIRHKPLKQVKIKNDNGITYIATYEEYTNPTMLRLASVYSEILFEIQKFRGDIIETERKNFRRFKHNLVTYNAHILQGIYKLISQDNLVKGGNDQIAQIEKKIREKPREAATLILKILKNVNLAKAEFDVYDFIYKTSQEMQPTSHSIHKVVYLALNTFWLDFLEKGISISIGECSCDGNFDYNSISVVLVHILDNALKYTAPKSELAINFKDSGDFVEICFDMISLKIEGDEINSIFEEGISGRWSEKINCNGSGLGLFIINKLVKINKGYLSLRNNVDHRMAMVVDGIPYEKNQIILSLVKYR